MLGRSALSDQEIADLRQRAWRQQGVLIVNVADSRLSDEERWLLRDIAERLHGGDPWK
ncbi:hypothetical protein HNR46_003962 [Haloferula luteola]|uniref:Uncharacterized protein n=1 Tax=Haloferula luteola TaxID=595692 RepID=A0A840VM47_9BACT|nr:hypothetical protein [Haloferula luteola]MBB5353701.1 hypothetical protein [Haloferula luteola]